MDDYKVQNNTTIDLNSLVDYTNEKDSFAPTMNYLQVQKEANILPVREKKMPMADPNVNFGKALLCSVCFLGMYIALYTAQNVQSKLFDDDGYDTLGNISNAFAYIGQGTGSVFCVFILMKYGAVKSMAYFAILNIPFIIALLLPAYKGQTDSNIFLLNDWFVYPVILITSLMNGFGQGVVQPASGNYISDCANEENKGFYFALFWSFYMGSQVFGNILAAFLLGNFPQQYFVMIITVICSAATGLLFTLKNPVVHHSDHPEGHAVGEGDEARNVTVKEGVLKLWNLCKDRRFLYIIPQSAWTGISIAYFSGNLIEMLEFHAPYRAEDDDAQQAQAKHFWALLAMALFGVGEILGSFFIGFFIDKIGSKLSTFINLAIILIMGGVSLGYIVIEKWNALAWLMCFFWGFQDSCLNTHCQEILGFEFDDNYTPFSLFNIWQCIMVVIFQLIESNFKNDTQSYMIYTIAITVLGLAMNSVTYFFPFREHLALTVDFHEAASRISGSLYSKKRDQN